MTAVSFLSLLSAGTTLSVSVISAASTIGAYFLQERLCILIGLANQILLHIAYLCARIQADTRTKLTFAFQILSINDQMWNWGIVQTHCWYNSYIEGYSLNISLANSDLSQCFFAFWVQWMHKTFDLGGADCYTTKDWTETNNYSAVE